MKTRITLLVPVVIAAIVCAGAAPPQKTRHRARTPASLPCGDLMSFQVLIDREGFSPGPIDGQSGQNFRRALTAFQTARGLSPSGTADCETWAALGGASAGPLVSEYTITDADANYAYLKSIPHDLVEQAKLDALGYSSIAERLAERFHASPALLQRLNQGKAMTAGTAISVPAVTPFDPDVKPSPDPAAGTVTVVVSREGSSLQVIGADERAVFFAPVTTGSEFDPLPVGDWTVKGTQWNPPFHYNPKLFWDAKPEHTKATIKPGPNNPAGVVWIALNLEHYGIHGTPEPSTVGRTASHGCVRMTNWDAARVAALVKPGTRVLFR